MLTIATELDIPYRDVGECRFQAAFYKNSNFVNITIIIFSYLKYKIVLQVFI